jgi:hypothetical protein
VRRRVEGRVEGRVERESREGESRRRVEKESREGEGSRRRVGREHNDDALVREKASACAGQLAASRAIVGCGGLGSALICPPLHSGIIMGLEAVNSRKCGLTCHST